MIIATPLPDELCRGHIGRMRHINGLRDYATTIACLRSGEGDKVAADKHTSVVEAIAEASGLALDDYLRLHTMLPFRSFVRSTSGGDDSQSTKRLRLLGAAPTRSASFFCPHCVESDLAARQYSYWRRGHQLPGMDKCPTHRTQLMFVDGWQAFDRQPDHWLRHNLSKTRPQIGKPACPFVSRFQRFALRLLNEDLAGVTTAFRRTIFERFQEHYPPAQGKRDPKKLTELASELIEDEWMADVFPTWKGSHVHRRYDPINVALLPWKCATAEAYCLAVSILFENPDDALRPPQSCKVPRLRHGAAVYLRYHELNGRIPAVASERGENVQALHRHLIRKRVWILQHPSGQPALRALRRFEGGEDLLEAANAEGVDMELVLNILRLYLSGLPQSKTPGNKHSTAKSAAPAHQAKQRARDPIGSSSPPVSKPKQTPDAAPTRRAKEALLAVSA